MRPTVSLLIPVYRGEAYIASTLRSVQAQDYSNFELLCIDDCSPDRSGEIILEMAAEDPRIRYKRTVTNLGNVPKVLNRHLGEMRGEYFAYASQDDSFSPDWLSSMVEAVGRTGADAVVPDLVFYDDDRGETRWLRNSARDPISGTEAFLLSLDWTIPGNAMFHRSLFERFGFFDFGMYADEYSWRYYFLHCRKVAFASGVFRYFQGNPNAITRKLSPAMLDRAYNDYRLWRLVEDHAPQSPWVRQYARQAFRSLRQGIAEITAIPSMRREAGRLAVALEAMRDDRDFRLRLIESFDRPLPGRMALLALAVPTLLRLGARIDRLRPGPKGQA